MSTNYYLVQDPCPHCKRAIEPLHIGKYATGWAFMLHIYPSMDPSSMDPFCRGQEEWNITINDLDEYRSLFMKYKILNEYNREISAETMLQIITECRGVGDEPLRRYEPEPLRCLGPGDGTWDLMIGQFS